MSDQPDDFMPDELVARSLGRRDADAMVTFSVRELLERMERKLDKAIETKADLADLRRAEARIDGHDTRLHGHDDRLRTVEAKLHDDVQHQKHVWTWKQRIYAGLGTFAVVAATVLGPYLATHL